MNTSSFPLPFDRDAVRIHKKRVLTENARHILVDDTAIQLLDRLGDIKKTFIHSLDLSPSPCVSTFVSTSSNDVEFDEELLPFGAESFDLIFSNLGLHWVNDLPGCLAQVRTILKSEGLFVASLFGDHSLHEFRSCLLDAELLINGGASPRFSPTLDLLTASQLMQRAGFTLPVVDKESLTLIYKDSYALMQDLRRMGQTNAHRGRPNHLSGRQIFAEADRLYKQRFCNNEGNILATFDIIYLHGWK